MKELYDHQKVAVADLRAGIREGHKMQVLAASTGFGKSIVAMHLIHSSMERGKRCLFLVDRRVLVDQFSQHLSDNGIDHGVLMAGHWRWRPQKSVQVASIQTMERMETWPVVDLIVIDEVHAVMRDSVCRLLVQTNAVVVGLTATPFHQKLAAHFSRISNTITMAELVQLGALVPFKVFASREIDVSGLKAQGDSWEKEKLQSRALQVVGDVVSDYVSLSAQVFGGPRKTIVFSSGVEHGKELARRFQEAGYNFLSISYKDDEEHKKAILEEFAKPDTSIQGVISTDILTRGFDQTDVEHVILAQPLRKSFSKFVQMIGRGARKHDGKQFCIARGSPVLTDSGLVPIEDITLDHMVWDGVNFVRHGGTVCRGVKPVMSYDGLTATPDHKVMTYDGWKTIETAAREQRRIVVTEIGGAPIRFTEDHFSSDGGQRSELEGASGVCGLQKQIHGSVSPPDATRKQEGLPNMQSTDSGRWKAQSVVDWLKVWVSSNLLARYRGKQLGSTGACQMQSMRPAKQGQISQHCQKTEHPVLRPLQSEAQLLGAEVAICALPSAAGQMHQRKERKLPFVRRAWDRVSVWLGGRSDRLGCEKLGAASEQEVPAGQNRQQRPLRAWKSTVGHSSKEYEQHKSIWNPDEVQRIQGGAPGGQICRQDASGASSETLVSGDCGALGSSVLQTKREVWDILNAGPLQRFTVSGRLVHNCLIQDNSGNWLRFQADWEALFHGGVQALPEGPDEKKRKERTEKEKEASCCPKCKQVWSAGAEVCSFCGHARERRSDVAEVAGVMQEVTGKAVEKYDSHTKERWFQELLKYARHNGYRDGWAFFAYQDKFGIKPAWKKTSAPAISPDVAGWITHRNIRKSHAARR